MARTENSEFKPLRSLGRMALLSTGVAVALAAAGYWPTKVQASPEGVPAMFVALAICVLGGWCGLLPTLLYLDRPPREIPNGVMLGLAVRFVVTLGLALAATLTRAFATAPLLIWVGTAQLVILMVDVIGLVRLLKDAAARNQPS